MSQPKISADNIDWEKSDGLVPAVVQHATTHRVLMLGYMNRESFEKTQESGKVTFYSRSRQQLWQKGETSGNTLDVEQIEIDCDADTVLVRAHPHGPTCHLLTESCFDRTPDGTAEITSETSAAAPSSESNTRGMQFIGQLQQLIESRKSANPDSSYTAQLFSSGTAKIAQKVGEEGVEVALAAVVAAMSTTDKTDSTDNSRSVLDEEFLGECADLVYHLLVVLAERGFEINDVAEVLRQRHSG